MNFLGDKIVRTVDRRYDTCIVIVPLFLVKPGLLTPLGEGEEEEEEDVMLSCTDR